MHSTWSSGMSILGAPEGDGTDCDFQPLQRLREGYARPVRAATLSGCTRHAVCDRKQAARSDLLIVNYTKQSHASARPTGGTTVQARRTRSHR